MDPRVNFATGVTDGLRTGMDLIDRRDTQNRRRVEWDQLQADRATQRERQDTTWEQQQADREYNMERRESEDAHRDAMLPIELAAKKAALTTAQTNQRVAQQREKSLKAGQVYSEAMALFEGGEYEQAEKTWEGLGQYGFDIEGMSTGGAQQAMDTMEGLLSGKLDYGSPEVRKLARQVLNPSLIQSGRDPDRFEVAGITPSGRMDESGQPTFLVSMYDKDTQQVVPATVNASSEVDDPVTEIPLKDLMTAAQTHISMATNSAEVRLRAMGARLGMQAAKDNSLERKKVQAEIDLLKAKTAKESGVDGVDDVASKITSDPIEALFLRSHQNDPVLGDIAKMLQKQPDFTPEEGVHAIHEMREIMSDKKFKDTVLTSSDVWSLYTSRKENEKLLAGAVGDHITQFTRIYPELADKPELQKDVAERVEAVMSRAQKQGVDADQVEARLKRIGDYIEKEFKSEKRAAENRQYWENRQAPKTYDPVGEAEAAR